MPVTADAVPGVPVVLDFESRRADGERGTMKAFELSSIIGSIAAVGIALGAIVIGSNANLRTEMRAQMHSLRTDIGADIRAMEARLSAVERHQARTEGLLEGLRDAITADSRRHSSAQNESS